MSRNLFNNFQTKGACVLDDERDKNRKSTTSSDYDESDKDKTSTASSNYDCSCWQEFWSSYYLTEMFLQDL